MKQIISLLCSLFLIGSLTSFTTVPTINKWEKLGSKKVNYRLDKDVIKVGAKEGTFTKLKIAVTNGSLNMHKMVVVYKNGQRDEIELRQNFSKKSDSRVIDLAGNKRFIDQIIFWYDSKNLSRKRAKVHVYGRH